MENSAAPCGIYGNGGRAAKRPAPGGDDDSDDVVLLEALAFIGDFELDEDCSVVTDAFGGSGCSRGPLDEAVPTTAPLDIASNRPCRSDINVSVGPSTISARSVASSPDATPRAKPVAARTHSYSKRRDELLYLRGLVQELEVRLADLRTRTDDPKDEPAGGDEQVHESSTMVAAWEQVAARQYEQRHRAEMENIKLKKLLEDQIQVGKSLERVLSRKRPKGLESLSGMTAPIPLRISPALSSQPTEGSTVDDAIFIFDDLFQSVDTQYPETERVFAKAEHTCPTVNHHETRLVHDPELGLVLQTTECRIFPFKYEETVETLWDSLPDIAIHGPHHVDKTELQQKIRFKVDISLGATRAAMEVFIATRKYVEQGQAERTVLVSTAVVDPSEISDIDMDGIRMRHKGWCVIEALPTRSDPNRVTPYATRMTTYSIATPEIQGTAVQDHSRKVGTLTNFVMSSISFDREARQQMLENRFLERSLRLAK